MRKWICLLAVLVMLTAFAGCGATPAESLSPLEELYREQEQKAQPVLEEYARRLEEAVKAAEDGDPISVCINGEVTVTDPALIHRLLTVLQKLELQVKRNADEAMFGEVDIIFDAAPFSIVFVYEDKEVFLGNWLISDLMVIRYPEYPDTPANYAVTNISTAISGEKAALEEAIDLPISDRNIG